MKRHYPNLAAYLDENGITQAEFAARMGIGQAAVSRILNGSRRPSLPLALRIAAEANIPIESLMPPAGARNGEAA
jgi:transcriptional regulator with XRE-family HTH domain